MEIISVYSVLCAFRLILQVQAAFTYNGSIVKTKIWQKISEPDISKLFCYATRVTKVK